MITIQVAHLDKSRWQNVRNGVVAESRSRVGVLEPESYFFKLEDQKETESNWLQKSFKPGKYICAKMKQVYLEYL